MRKPRSVFPRSASRHMLPFTPETLRRAIRYCLMAAGDDDHKGVIVDEIFGPCIQELVRLQRENAELADLIEQLRQKKGVPEE